MGNLLSRRQTSLGADGSWEVHVNQSAAHHAYQTNRVSNSKYSLLTFLPLNIRDQLRYFINRYFILIGVLQLWSEITPVNVCSRGEGLWLGLCRPPSPHPFLI